MRYPPDRKIATRQRIVAAASRAFRERGVAETGVDEVMRRAGLTHGGFYAHFRDKAELVGEACVAAFAEAVPNLKRISARRTRAERIRLLIDSYLGTSHRDNRSAGCAIVAVAADVSRLEGDARAAYSRALEVHLERLADALRLADDPAENLAEATHLMSALVGALLCARALGDSPRSAAVLRAMRLRLKAQFAPAELHHRRAGERAAPPDFSPSHDLLRAL